VALTFRELHPCFAAEVSPIDLRHAGEHDLEQIRAGMDQHAVLVCRDQQFTDEDQLAFAQRLDGELYRPRTQRIIKNRLRNNAISDISNLDDEGALRDAADRNRWYYLANRLWHTDGSFQSPASRYSTLSARELPPDSPDTQFADMRAAYDALSPETKRQIEGLQAFHSIVHSRGILGFEFSDSEQDILQGAVHPLVRSIPRSGRKSLYLASHISKIIDWPVPDGRLFVFDLIEHATQREFVFSHSWRVGDLVIWDNRATMHRARPFADTKYRREMHRVTTLDVDQSVTAGA
jgi:alpha-ketoglutarate-dependent 2,4-dichlorophenoxyacetate dioxygenase